MIYRLMKTELKVLFYSPIAWLILIIFTIQVSLTFSNVFEGQIQSQALGYRINSLTYTIFSGASGIFVEIQHYLYLYIPLLTMGLMSREFSSGSIRLLYSSPATDFQIIIGKYLAIVVYALILIALLLVYVLFSWVYIKDMELVVALVGVLGIFLLACTFGAIGLFMSVLTSYQVVAAMGTLVVLAVLNYIGQLGQEIDVVRDITYWLSVPKHISDLINGLLCSKDLIYFPVVILLFISLSILNLKGRRAHFFSFQYIGKCLLVLLLALGIGYLSTIPRLLWYKDVTYVGRNTLSKQSQDIMKLIPENLTITTYVNLLDENSWLGMPKNRIYDLDVFQKYVRFKPDTKLRYVYYYDKAYNPVLDEQHPDMTTQEKAEWLMKVNGYRASMFLTPQEIHKQIDLSGEGNRMVRLIESSNGRKAFLRIFGDARKQPDEAQITTAMKRLTEKAPKVVFTTGHGERSCKGSADRNYGYLTSIPFRNSLVNIGFDVEEVTLKSDADILETAEILVLADPVTAFSEAELQKIEAYINDGRNMLVCLEPKNKNILKDLLFKLGVDISNDGVIQNDGTCDSEVIVGQVNPNMPKDNGNWKDFFSQGRHVVMQNAVRMELSDSILFETMPLVQSKEQQKPLIVELSRKVNGRHQSIIVAADADFMSTGEISRSYSGVNNANFAITTELFALLCDYHYPVQLSWPDPIDNELYLSMQSVLWIKLFFLGILPLLMLLGWLVLWKYRCSR